MGREIVCGTVRERILTNVPRGVTVDVIPTRRRGLRVAIPAQNIGGVDIPTTELRGKNPGRLAREAAQTINELIS